MTTEVPDQIATSLRALRRGLSRADGFALFVAVSNSPARTKRLIAELDDSLPDVELETVELQAGVTDPLDAVLDQVDQPSSAPLMIVGLEHSIRSDQPDAPALQALNLRRPEWPKLLPRPLVLWVPEYLLGILGRQTPDYLDWRSDTVFFPDVEEELLKPVWSETWAGGRDGRMSAEDRRLRIEELQSRITSLRDSKDTLAQQCLSQWLIELGNHMLLLGNLRDAENAYDNALHIASSLGFKELIASSYANLAQVYILRGQLDRSEEMIIKSLEFERRSGRQEGMAADYGSLGLIHWNRRELKRAEEMYRKAIDIHQELGNQEGVAHNYGNLGLIYMARGELDRAEEIFTESLRINERLGRHQGMAIQYGNLGLIYWRLGELARSEEMHRKALEIDERLGRQEGVANHYGNLGLIYEQQGNASKARKLWNRARDLYQNIGMPHMVEKVQRWLNELENT